MDYLEPDLSAETFPVPDFYERGLEHCARHLYGDRNFFGTITS
jgi:hypothetical protein